MKQSNATQKQRGRSGHLAVADADGALQVPTGGGQLLQLVQGEAEAAAVGARGWRAGLHHEQQLLHHGAGALGAHHATHHFNGEDHAAHSLAKDLHRTQKRRIVCLFFFFWCEM